MIDLLIFPGAIKTLIKMFIPLIVTAAIGALTPIFIKELASSYQEWDLFKLSLFKLLILYIVEYFNRAYYEISSQHYIRDLIYSLRRRVYTGWLYSPVSDLKKGDKYPLGEIISRIMNDAEALRELVTSGGLGLFIEFFFLISSFVSFILINVKIGSGLIAIEVVFLLLLLYGSKYIRKVFNEVRISRGILSRTLSDILAGLSSSYYQGGEEYVSKRTLDSSERFLKDQLKSNFYDASFFALSEALYPLTLILMSFLIILTRSYDPSIILSVLYLVQISITPIKRSTMKIASIQRALTGIDRIGAFLRAEQESICHIGELKPSKALVERLEISLKEFAYPKRPGVLVLKDVDLVAKAGEFIGIAGPSGSGKSTLLKLISLELDSIDLKLNLFLQDGTTIEYQGGKLAAREHYSSLVGLVSQESHLFTESLAFNISLSANPDDRLNSFWNDMKREIPYLNRWGMSLEDVVSLKTVSSGQKQLIAAIRSLYLNHPIVLFDEISAGLDSELEASIRELILLIQKKSIAIFVAHRIETLRDADQIWFVEKGIVTNRTYKQLLEDS